MGTPSEYVTIAGEATAEISERRSVFRCVLRRCDSPDAMQDFIAECRARHHDARHHCSAAVIGADRMVRYRSDDGEPAGSAGDPMLAVLLGAGASDVAAVVTRWFGGTLLGTGGLVRAYGSAVQAALDAAEFRTRSRRNLIEIVLSHTDAGRVEAALRASGAVVVDAHYAEAVTLRIAAVDRDAIRAHAAALTSGQARFRDAGSQWMDE